MVTLHHAHTIRSPVLVRAVALVAYPIKARHGGTPQRIDPLHSEWGPPPTNSNQFSRDMVNI